MTLNGNTLSSIQNGSNTLTSGTDYSVSETMVTINRTYLAGLPTGRWKASLSFKLGCDIVEKESKLSIKGGENLKNRLEQIRKQRGIKQDELADILEVSRQTIGSLENGRYNPSIILAFKIANYFNMSIEEIFIYEEEQNNEKK